MLFFCTIAREIFFFLESRKNLTFRRINHASTYTKVYYGHTRFYLGCFCKVSLKIKKIQTKQCAKLDPSKKKGRQCIMLCLSHTYFCFVCCCCFNEEKGLCVGGLRGKVRGRLLIITNSIN